MQKERDAVIIEAEQQRLAALLEKKPVLARVAASSFISAFELIKPEKRNETKRQKPA